MESIQSIQVKDIKTDGRVRRDYGNLQELAASIKETGLIQPIVVSLEANDTYTLLAGGRRLKALQKLGITELEHAKHYVFREEVDELTAKAIELEENLKRKNLSWTEELEAKQKLFEIMQQTHGKALSGRAAEAAKKRGESVGFGVRALAAMLNESPATVSMDLDMAKNIAKIPILKQFPTKESARRRLGTGVLMMGMAKLAAAKAAASPAGQTKYWTLYEGDFRNNISKVPSASVDLVYSDLPFGVSLTTFSKHNTALAQYQDSRTDVVAMLGDICKETKRVLQDNRFGIFFFGFNYYCDLINAITAAGLRHLNMPVVWVKGTHSCENPHIQYASSYDAAIVCMKGSPQFIRQGQSNVVNIPAVQGKLHIAQQPVDLVKKFLDDMVGPGATVLDFCAGSGTTGEAAVRSKRHVILFERDTNMCQLIRNRLGAL